MRVHAEKLLPQALAINDRPYNEASWDFTIPKPQRNKVDRISALPKYIARKSRRYSFCNAISLFFEIQRLFLISSYNGHKDFI